jgi:hypothetical protein
MAFSQDVKDKAYRRAGGKCECDMKVCKSHTGRCNKSLANGWHAHHKHSVAGGGDDTLSNCQAMCVSCHENTRSYGRS